MARKLAFCIKSINAHYIQTLTQTPVSIGIKALNFGKLMENVLRLNADEVAINLKSHIYHKVPSTNYHYRHSKHITRYEPP